MFKPIYDKLEKEVSGEIAFNYVAEISRNHRIQASPGLRAAVEYAVGELRSRGLEARVDSHPADGRSYSWSSLHFREWSCEDAELELLEPEGEARFLARWSESKLSLIQRSQPTPEGGVEAEVVVMDKGEEEADYRRVDVAGKIVLTDGDVGRVHELAVERHGALGIIYDGTWVRPPALLEGELDDALKYTSFWWAGDERPAFGFVLTPRNGRWLRKLVEERKRKRGTVRVRARVDSQLYDGSIENAVAVIPGETEEEVVVVAHICHPQPSANDNASGSAAAMEAARALWKLIDAGELPRPRRSIRFTLVPEMAGTYNYLAANESDILGMVAALNLDMVGEKQELTGGPLIVERTPEASPSYVNSLMEAIFEEVRAEAKNLGGSSSYALFKHAITPFSGGSDHYIYSDPSVGVACPMVIQWPDKFWHTSYDTLDKVDPAMLRRVALMTATYAYFIASAGPAEAVWLASEVAARERSRLASEIQRLVTGAMIEVAGSSEPEKALAEALGRLRRLVPYRLDRAVAAVRSAGRLAGGSAEYDSVEGGLVSGLEAAAKAERRAARDAVLGYAEARRLALPSVGRGRLRKLEAEARGIVPRRVFRGPVSLRPWVRRLPPEDRDEWHAFGKRHEEAGRSQGTLALYWADGVRGLLEISRLVELEAGSVDLGYLVGLFGWLRRMGLVEW
jgi:aminopeptidase YwaD